MITQWFHNLIKTENQRKEESCYGNFADMYGKLLQTNTDLREQIQEQQRALNNLVALITIHSKKDISIGLTQEGLPYFIAAEVTDSRMTIRVYNYLESLQWKAILSIKFPKGNGLCTVDESERESGYKQIVSEKLSSLLVSKGITLAQLGTKGSEHHNRFFLQQT